jgi:hypothetical protein
MLIYNVGFINEDNERDETQLDIAESNMEDVMVELMNLILSLKEEMGIKEITYIECVGRTEEEE